MVYSSLRVGALLILRAARSNLDTPAIYSTTHLRSALLYSPSAMLFGLLPSHGTGESGARARLASRTVVRCYFLVAIGARMTPISPPYPLEPFPSWRGSAEPVRGRLSLS